MAIAVRIDGMVKDRDLPVLGGGPQGVVDPSHLFAIHEVGVEEEEARAAGDRVVGWPSMLNGG